jgi:hypothetical protein
MRETAYEHVSRALCVTWTRSWNFGARLVLHSSFLHSGMWLRVPGHGFDDVSKERIAVAITGWGIKSSAPEDDCTTFGRNVENNWPNDTSSPSRIHESSTFGFHNILGIDSTEKGFAPSPFHGVFSRSNLSACCKCHEDWHYKFHILSIECISIFIWITGSTAICSVYSINWLVLSVYCAVRTGPLYKIQLSS